MSLKFCANISVMFRENPYLPDRYRLAKQAGFSAVECQFPYEYSICELEKKKENENLEHVLIDTYPGNILKGQRGFAALPECIDEFQSSIDLSIQYAKALKCKKIHIMAGVVKSPTTENDETYKNNLLYAVKMFEKEQIIGLIEPINHYLRPNYYLNSYEKAVSIVEEINSPNLRLTIDVYHLQHLKGNLTYNLKNYFPYVGHIQIAQVPGRNEPDALGEINYFYIFKVLKELQYSDWIGLEYDPSGSTAIGLKWMEMLKHL